VNSSFSIFLPSGRHPDVVNYQLFHLINSAAGNGGLIDAAMRFSAVYLIFAVFAVGAALTVHAVRRRRIREVLGFGATLVVAFGLAQALARLSPETRPFQSHAVHQLIAHGPGVSMPSDHATAAFAVGFGVLVFLHRRTGIALLAAATLIGFARVWVGVHYPGDILASAVIAGLATLFVHVVSLGPRELTRI
jgi:undecaprenyl-diphosphatase